MKIIANARLMQSRLTGQPRYFAEVIERLPQDVRSIAPKKKLGASGGHLWEQFVLPRTLGDSILWSPSNTGPLSVRRQVVTIHDVSMLLYPEWFERKFAAWYNFLLPRLAKRVLRILTVSEFSRQEIARVLKVPEEKVVVGYNAVSEKFRPSTQDQIKAALDKLKIEKPYVLIVGSVQPRKNVRRLLDAWRSLGSKLGDIELIVAGGSYGVFADSGLGELPPNVRLLGYITEEDLVPLYGGALAFVYPSLYEGFGMPVLEAMACGTPVVTSQGTSLSEVSGGAAIEVDPRDVGSIAAGIQQVVESESLRARLRDLGLVRAKCFSWDDTANRVWRVLKEAVDQK